MVLDNAGGFAEQDENDYAPRERHGAANDDVIPNRSQSAGEVNDDKPERYAEDYAPANVAHILRESKSAFATLKEEQNNAGLAKQPWAPFDDEGEWELAQFLIKEVSQTATNKFLNLSIVSVRRALTVELR
jgi:hypothetical protein